MHGQGGDPLTWSVAIQCVSCPWCFLCGAGQGQPPPVFCLGHSAWAVKQSEMAANCAGLGDSQAKPNCDSNLAAAKTH